MNGAFKNRSATGMYPPAYVLSMTLAQSGTQIAGTLQRPHGPVPLKGEIRKGKITFSGSSDAEHRLEISATGALQPNGTMAGDLMTNVGNMTWKAVRNGGR